MMTWVNIAAGESTLVTDCGAREHRRLKQDSCEWKQPEGAFGSLENEGKDERLRLRYTCCREKLKRQTFDTMDRWKGRGVKSLRRKSETRKIRRKKSEEGRCRRAKTQKTRNIVFFQCLVAPEGRKVGSLKWRAWSRLVA